MLLLPPVSPQFALSARIASAARTSRALVHSSSCSKTHAHTHPAQPHSGGVEPTGPVRVRFAPSPTGMLHLGGLRTALFNYLLARRYGGEFILRIEDTDQKRLVAGAAENIVRTLAWAGLDFDEGPGRPGTGTGTGASGPYFQSQRGDTYRKHAADLLARGAAYRCFCSAHRLDRLRQDAVAQGRPPMYDRHCLHLSQAQTDAKLRAGDAFTVRFRMPGAAEPGSGAAFDDIVHGAMRFRGPAGFDDAVLLKSDGLPTYHLANVVDDHLMRITHVLRGEEWLISTPKHRALFAAFGWPAPQYAHLPLLMNADGSKLSKRNADAPVQNYVDKGYLPAALINYAALLGWHPGTASAQEIYTLPQLERSFSLAGLSRSKSVVSRDRLDWLNRQHLRMQIDDPATAPRLAEQAALEINNKTNPVAPEHPLAQPADTLRALRLCADRLTFTRDLYDAAPFLFADPDLGSPDADAVVQKVPADARITLLQAAIAQITTKSNLPSVAAADAMGQDRVPAEQWVGFAKEIAATAQVPAKYAMMMLRFALTGQHSGPKIPDLMAYFPVSELKRRLQRAADALLPPPPQLLSKSVSI